MMSSSTEASGPTRLDLVEIVGERRLELLERLGALDPHGTQVAHVEGDGLVATGPVLGQRPVGIAERHVPTAERHHLGVQDSVGIVER
jgi:hypothetical protein